MVRAYLFSMTFALAYSTLGADSPRQRARCSASGRFVPWARVPQLRAVGAPRVVVIAAPLVAVSVAVAAPVAEAPPVVAAAALVAKVRRWSIAGARALVAGARAVLVAGAIAIAGGAACGQDVAPPAEVVGCR